VVWQQIAKKGRETFDCIHGAGQVEHANSKPYPLAVQQCLTEKLKLVLHV